jgi:cystathionine beta-lyase/cystathionine gamma-synthase
MNEKEEARGREEMLNKERRKREEACSVTSQLIHGRFRTEKWDYTHHIVPPISSSTAYRLETQERGAKGFFEFLHPEQRSPQSTPIYIYDRLEEPDRSILEENLARVEEGETALCYGSGMAAISAANGVLTRTGKNIVSHCTLYGCTYSLFTNWYPRYGIEVKFADLRNPDILRETVTPETQVIYFETPANPTLEVVDIAAIRTIVDIINADREDEDKIKIVVDNTFATPFCQRPLKFGADFVVHSLSKNICGFGTDLGGVVIGPKWYENLLMGYRKDFGGALSPKSAWAILVYGLPTLGLRVRRQQATALKLAQCLEASDRVKRVSYPGLESFPQHELARRQMVDPYGEFAPGIMIYFELEGDLAQREKRCKFLLNHLADYAYTLTLAVSLGQIRTLIENPGHMTHAQMSPEDLEERGIDPFGIRMSIGLEDADDLCRDLEYGLAALE